MDLFCCAGKRDRGHEDSEYPEQSDREPMGPEPRTTDTSSSRQTPQLIPNKPWYKPDVHNLDSMNSFTSNAPFMEVCSFPAPAIFNRIDTSFHTSRPLAIAIHLTFVIATDGPPPGESYSD